MASLIVLKYPSKPIVCHHMEVMNFYVFRSKWIKGKILQFRFDISGKYCASVWLPLKKIYFREQYHLFLHRSELVNI